MGWRTSAIRLLLEPYIYLPLLITEKLPERTLINTLGRCFSWRMMTSYCFDFPFSVVLLAVPSSSRRQQQPQQQQRIIRAALLMWCTNFFFDYGSIKWYELLCSSTCLKKKKIEHYYKWSESAPAKCQSSYRRLNTITLLSQASDAAMEINRCSIRAW